MSIAQKPTPQEVRIARAKAESFRFRLVDVKTSAGPITAAYCYSPSGNVYLIHPGSHSDRCSCPDFQRRWNGTKGNGCKHIHALHLWLANGAAAPTDESEEEPAAEPAPTPAAALAPIVNCAVCGTLLAAADAVATIRRRDGSAGGHVCRNVGACLTRRQGPPPAGPDFLASREQLWEDHAPVAARA